MARRTPRESLEAALESAETRRRYVRRLFERIAGRYDLITRLLSCGLDQRWKRRLLHEAHVVTGTRVLDLACGTGDLALGASRRGARVAALDIALPMLRRASAKPGAGRVAWLAGDMGALPLAPGSFELVTTGYGLRNVPVLADAVAAVHDVLVAGGRFCALDFDRPESPWLRALYLSYLTVIGSALGWVLHGDPDTYRYIAASLRRYPGARRVAALLRSAGFEDVRVIPLLGGLMALHVARKPSVPPSTRGISYNGA